MLTVHLKYRSIQVFCRCFNGEIKAFCITEKKDLKRILKELRISNDPDGQDLESEIQSVVVPTDRRSGNQRSQIERRDRRYNTIGHGLGGLGG